MTILAHHQLALSVGNATVIKHITASEMKELHGLNAFDGYHQPGNRKPSKALERPLQTLLVVVERLTQRN